MKQILGKSIRILKEKISNEDKNIVSLTVSWGAKGNSAQNPLAFPPNNKDFV